MPSESSPVPFFLCNPRGGACCRLHHDGHFTTHNKWRRQRRRQNLGEVRSTMQRPKRHCGTLTAAAACHAMPCHAMTRLQPSIHTQTLRFFTEAHHTTLIEKKYKDHLVINMNTNRPIHTSAPGGVLNKRLPGTPLRNNDPTLLVYVRVTSGLSPNKVCAALKGFQEEGTTQNQRSSGNASTKVYNPMHTTPLPSEISEAQ